MSHGSPRPGHATNSAPATPSPIKFEEPRWGRLARQDIFVFDDGGTWSVEYREGGGESRSQWLECADEDAVLEAVHTSMTRSDDWKEMR